MWQMTLETIDSLLVTRDLEKAQNSHKQDQISRRFV